MSDDDDTPGAPSAAAGASYGTPLPALEEDDATTRKHKPIALEDQIVTDENGRRRFHGAFTGGFSAGFFNTAGSRDGWSPAHFKSSRTSRNEASSSSNGAKIGLRPEDFMDAEDLGAFGIAPQGIRASSQFRQPQSRAETEDRKRKAESSIPEGPIPGDPVLEQLVKAAQDTVGTKLLRNMGWKPGQGVGPRLSRRQRRRNRAANIRMFGSSLPEKYRKDGEEEKKEDEEGEDEEFLKYKDFLFAPDDVPDFVAKPKDNTFGIGYSGLDRNALFGGGKHFSLFDEPGNPAPGSSSGSSSGVLRVKDKKKNLSIRGQAFGVGAYEEEDEDIYQRDDMSR